MNFTAAFNKGCPSFKRLCFSWITFKIGHYFCFLELSILFMVIPGRMEMQNERLNILRCTYSELVDEFKRRYGKGAFHAAALYREIFRNGNQDVRTVEAFAQSPILIEKLKKDLVIPTGTVNRILNETDLIKFTTRLNDGFEIESVIIPMTRHYTVCISSQAGCRMGCVFCETGRQGFHRNLEADEIVGQVFAAKFNFGADIRNVVFMGMGEPMDNLKNVLQAIRILIDPRGMNIARRRITISTVGLADKIRKLSVISDPTVKLAVSLNAPNDRIRSRIMPINQIWPMGKLKEVLLKYPLKRKDAFMMEYVLISGVNDAREHADELSEFLTPLKAKVNIIPLNLSTARDFSAPADSVTDRFCERLGSHGVFVRKRGPKGHTVMAACGQLGGSRS